MGKRQKGSDTPTARPTASAIVPRLRNLPLRAVAACCLLLLALPLASYKLLLATCHLPLLLPACYLLLAACCLQLAVLHCARWYDPTEWAFASSIYIYMNYYIAILPFKALG